MSKEGLKNTISEKQNGECALTGETLRERTELFDTDRKKPKAEGGIYTGENTRVVTPVAHMARHGNLRVRSEGLTELKALVDDKEQMLKLRNKINNQILAYERRTDDMTPDTLNFLQEQIKRTDSELKDRVKRVEKWVDKRKNSDPLVAATLGVKSVGAQTVAYCIAYIDLAKARHASSLWAYAGLDKASHERYTKGEASGGNKALRCALWNMADSQMKGNGAYRPVYDATKARLAASEKMTKSRNTQGKLVEVLWKDTKPSHRHGAALRAVMKHFLADFWYVGRTLMGLPTDPLYVESMLGHTSIIRPMERGWKINYPKKPIERKRGV